MSLRLQATHIQPSQAEPHDSEGESSSEDEEDQTWDDWVSDSMSNRPCKSLFEDRTFDTVQEALAHDEATHGFSLKDVTTKLGELGVPLCGHSIEMCGLQRLTPTNAYDSSTGFEKRSEHPLR